MFHGSHHALAEKGDVDRFAFIIWKHATAALHVSKEQRAKQATKVVGGSQRTSDECRK